MERAPASRSRRSTTRAGSPDARSSTRSSTSTASIRESTTTAFNELVSKEVDAIILGYHNVTEPNDILAAYGAPYLNASTSIRQVTRAEVGSGEVREHLPGRPDRGAVRLRLPALPRGPDRRGGFSTRRRRRSTSSRGTSSTARPSRRLPGRGSRSSAGRSSASIRSTPRAARQPVTDWTPFIAKVKDSGATVTFNTHWNPADHAAFMKQWVADPPDAFLYLQYGASVPEFLEIAGDAARTAPSGRRSSAPMNDPVGLAFQERYQAKWDAPAGFSNAGTGYDEVYLLAHAWGITGDPRELRGQHRRAQAEHLPRRLGRLLVRARGGELLPLLPGRDRRIRRSGTRTCSSRSCPTTAANLAHQIIDPAPYIQTEYVQQPWLSF